MIQRTYTLTYTLSCSGHKFESVNKHILIIAFGLHSRGIYREILFLTMAALGKDHVDIGEGAGMVLRNLGTWSQVWGVGILIH